MEKEEKIPTFSIETEFYIENDELILGNISLNANKNKINLLY